MAPTGSSDKPDSSDSQSQSSSCPSPNHRSFSFVFDIPRAIFDHGAEHGREWRRVCKGDGREGRVDPDRRWRCNRTMARNEAEAPATTSSSSSSPASPNTSALAGGSNPDDDWYQWTRRELEKGERRAKEIYDSWNVEQHKHQDAIPPSSSPSKPSDSTSSDNWQGWPLARLEDFFKHIRGPPSEHQSPEIIFQNLMKSHAELERQMASMIPFSPMRDFNRQHVGGLWPSFKSTHVMDYIASSEYSPVVLESEPGFDSTWRARFEDLIRVDQGNKMLEAKEANEARNQTHWEWLCRFEPQDTESKDNTFDKFLGFGNEQKSELDAYEHFLSEQRGTAENNKQRNRPVSVVRTVNSYTKPDGSIKKTRTTRKTYADGRVEENQKVETVPPPPQSPPASSTPLAPVEEKTVSRPTPEKKKGWFWSN
jgi:hypothetical protein